ncbi:MAG TPA: hypothetical protein PLK30_08325 [Blastocatellia bacterium]|nr:hypothetical protein [Blastocatellia bacterium]
MKRFTLFIALAVIAFGLSSLKAEAKLTSGMLEGAAKFQSMGPLAFGPDGILFVADTKAAAIIALSTGDTKPAAAGKLLKVDAINQKIAALLGTAADQILIEDMVINPISHNAYLAVSRGRGADAVPVLVRVKTDGAPEVVSLENVKFSRADLPDAPADKQVGQGNRQNNPRRESITDIGYLNGRLFIAGLANEEFSSTLRSIAFPFKTVDNGTQVEIYHGAHGQFETRAPVRTFTTFKIGKEDHLLAAYTCTPLVQFPVSDLKPGAKIMGKTIAELGNRNRPLDMIVYQKDGKTYLLMANSSRGVMKITTDSIDKVEAIKAPVPDGGKKGLTYETIEGWTGVDQLDRFDAGHVAVLRRGEGGSLNLEALVLP